MVAIVNALKWMANYLETRFPAKITPLSAHEFVQWRDSLVISLNAAEKKIEVLEKQIEILNLRVGLTKPTQSAFGRKLNG